MREPIARLRILLLVPSRRGRDAGADARLSGRWGRPGLRGATRSMAPSACGCRYLARHLSCEHGAAVDRADHAQAPADRRDAVLESAQPRATSGVRAADPVV